MLRDTVLRLHQESLTAHGGTNGVRDEGLLDSALGKPLNLFGAQSFDLAASYAFGLAKNHPFLDGNKRTAFVIGVLFLELNGHRLLVRKKTLPRALLPWPQVR